MGERGRKKNEGWYRERERERERESGKEKESKNKRESAHGLTYICILPLEATMNLLEGGSAMDWCDRAREKMKDGIEREREKEGESENKEE